MSDLPNKSSLSTPLSAMQKVQPDHLPALALSLHEQTHQRWSPTTCTAVINAGEDPFLVHKTSKANQQLQPLKVSASLLFPAQNPLSHIEDIHDFTGLSNFLFPFHSKFLFFSIGTISCQSPCSLHSWFSSVGVFSILTEENNCH